MVYRFKATAFLKGDSPDTRLIEGIGADVFHVAWDNDLSQFAAQHECAVREGIKTSWQMNAGQIAATPEYGHIHVRHTVRNIGRLYTFTIPEDVHVYPAERFGEIHLRQGRAAIKTIFMDTGYWGRNVKCGPRVGYRIVVQLGHILGIKHAVNGLEMLAQRTAREKPDLSASD